jgi:hypothetical protein
MSRLSSALRTQAFPLFNLLLVLAGALLGTEACRTPTAWAQDYVVREIISVRPGEHQTREFLVSKRFSLTRPGPVEAFIVYSWGITEPAGTLTVELSFIPSGHRGWVIAGLLAAGYSLDRGPVLKFFHTTSPETLSASVPIESTFGIYYIGVAILAASSSKLFPVPLEITFSVIPATPAPAGHNGYGAVHGQGCSVVSGETPDTAF